MRSYVVCALWPVPALRDCGPTDGSVSDWWFRARTWLLLAWSVCRSRLASRKHASHPHCTHSCSRATRKRLPCAAALWVRESIDAVNFASRSRRAENWHAVVNVSVSGALSRCESALARVLATTQSSAKLSGLTGRLRITEPLGPL